MDKDSKRVEGRNSPFQGPSGAGRWVAGYTWDAVRRTWKKWRGAMNREGQRKGPGRGGALKRAEVTGGQVRTGNAVTDASYVL
jgi:hypothetical protein